MPVTRLNDDERTTRTSIALAEDSGWILRVERNGQIVATEHHHDWHRVERRRRLLEARMPMPRRLPASRSRRGHRGVAIHVPAERPVQSESAETTHGGSAVRAVRDLWIAY